MYKKFRSSFPNDNCHEWIYAKGRLKDGFSNNLTRHEYNVQVRVVPAPGGNWAIPQGHAGHTLARLEDDGNGVDIQIDDKCIRLDYCQLHYLKLVLYGLAEVDSWNNKGNTIVEDGFTCEELPQEEEE